MNQRRLLLLAFGAALTCNPALLRAQARAGVPRIGVLLFGTAPSGTDPDPDKGVRQGLRDLGYVEGQNILIERRYADGRPDRLAALVAELVQLKVDVIFAGGPAPREAASKATSTIPIVTVSGSDPVSEGWARSLAHPGGNVTGLTVTFPELGPKRLELLKQAFPGIVRVAVLIAPTELLDAKEVMQNMEADAPGAGAAAPSARGQSAERLRRGVQPRAAAPCPSPLRDRNKHRGNPPLAARGARRERAAAVDQRVPVDGSGGLSDDLWRRPRRSGSALDHAN